MVSDFKQVEVDMDKERIRAGYDEAGAAWLSSENPCTVSSTAND
jgi:hypothetical protein